VTGGAAASAVKTGLWKVIVGAAVADGNSLQLHLLRCSAVLPDASKTKTT